ncbi:MULTISPECIES: peptidoglycan D,D-transpeptidase FtsI family protein [Catenuloplanes]|uniref:Peptidoglycan glycosyltransferase n=1 Tax=Catenuloplanes niger TaxID=587534 RepID=A0AAE4CT20_9ACTN|nr:penicillin-binding transpeptidase domain-containing protein [Catenuloplanes niger]MDR7323620.1 peptidoglycan glycosyltransferase [Catenuloplanes niger]
MNAPLRKASIVILVLFGLLFANLNWVQAAKGEEYRTHERNSFRLRDVEYDKQRGNIEVHAGGTSTEAVALSKSTDGRLRYQREYPFGDVYAHVAGYKPVYGTASSVERFENDYLSGQSDELFTDRVRAMFTGEEAAGGNVLLSISKAAQEAAYKELKENKLGVKVGAAVALDPSTGGIQAMVSMPSFDPSPLASHTQADTDAAFAAYDGDKAKPLLNRAVAETWPPGSVFKVIDSAAALEAGSTPETMMQAGPSYVAPGTTHEITNASANVCPQQQISLIDALTVSCNTSFSRLGVELGRDVIKKKAQDFGFEDEALTCGNLKENSGLTVATSHVGDVANADGTEDKAAMAQTAIGQKDVRITPLQGAMIAAAVANDGVQMRPYLVERLLGPDRTSTHYTVNPEELRRSVSSDVARDLQTMMESVVNNGTATSAQVEGYDVGGKTGTSQNGVTDNHGWFVGYAMKDGKAVSAVAVFLEAAGNGGSAEATRIAGQILKAVTSERGGN